MKPTNKVLLTLALALAVTVTGLAAHTISTVSAQPESVGTELPIVMYHHVLKEQARLNDYTISPDEFRTDMQYIKENPK